MIIRAFVKMKNVIWSIVIFSLAVSVCVVVFTFSLRTPRVRTESFEVDNTQTQIGFLEEVVSNYPTYFDAHLELSRLYLLEGNVVKAKESLAHAKQIDPNSKSIKNYEEIFSSLN